MPVSFWRNAPCVLLTSLLLLCALPAHAQRTGAAKTPLQEALHKGDYAQARQLSLQYDDAPSMLARVELAQMRGDLDEALRLAEVAERLESVSPQERRAIVTRLAHVQRLRGDREGAEATLRALLQADPKAYRARLELGELLWERGDQKAAEPLLDELGNLFNNGLMTTPEDLVTVGRAMRRLGNYQDANYAFERAYDLDPTHLETLVAWGKLFLEKYNNQDAIKTFDEALAINPNHPDALIGRAWTEMGRASRHNESRAMLERAEQAAPKHPDLMLARAHLAIWNNQMQEARGHVEAILASQPLHLDALTMVAVIERLQDHDEAFEAALAKVLAVNPKYASALTQAGDWSILRFRYIEAMELYERALKIDPRDAGALFGLGIGYSRTNREAEAVEYLQRAYAEDAYNMRLVFTLNLYEQDIKDFTFLEYDGFRIRAHNSEFDLVNMYVAPVVKQAREVFSKKYHHTPEKDLSVEVYPTPETFSIRSVGVPMISANGVCFGKLVTVHSPSIGLSNWRQVLWHELAHVFHLQLSKFRTTRWFTEGLAEYETNVWDPSWQRYYQRDLALEVFSGQVPSVVDLDRGFTHAKDVQETVRAYYLASLAIHFIAQTWGFEKVRGMLGGYATYGETKKVVEEVLGTSVEAFDAKFLAWLKGTLRDFQNQYVLDLSQLPEAGELETRLKLNPLDAQALAYLALLAQRGDDMKQANDLMGRAEALAKDGDHPEVHYVGVVVRLMQNMPKEALAHGRELIGRGRDGYDLRMALAQAAKLTEQMKLSQMHLHAASQLYPQGQEAWMRLYQLGTLQQDESMRSLALQKYWELDAHQAEVSKLYVEDRLQAGDAKAVQAGLERWLDIAPFGEEVHRQTIKAADLTKDEAALVRAWETLVAMAPAARRKEVQAQAKEDLKRRGLLAKHAERFKQE